jgi:Trk K+ transport system NAD-binding subunit
MITHPDLHSEYEYGNAEVELVEIALPAGLEGRSVADLDVPGEIAVAVVVRTGQALIAEPGLRFESGDVLFLNVVRESGAKLERLLGLKE